MKKSVVFLMLMVIFTLPSFAQKYAYIDSEYILGNMPEYVEAQAELDRLAAEWQKEIEVQFTGLILCTRNIRLNRLLFLLI